MLGPLPSQPSQAPIPSISPVVSGDNDVTHRSYDGDFRYYYGPAVGIFLSLQHALTLHGRSGKPNQWSDALLKIGEREPLSTLPGATESVMEQCVQAPAFLKMPGGLPAAPVSRGAGLPSECSGPTPTPRPLLRRAPHPSPKLIAPNCSASKTAAPPSSPGLAATHLYEPRAFPGKPVGPLGRAGPAMASGQLY